MEIDTDRIDDTVLGLLCFRFKSFMAEMVLSKMLDEGQDFSDYPEALQAFFSYIANSGLNERIIFEDYYPKSTAKVCKRVPAASTVALVPAADGVIVQI